MEITIDDWADDYPKDAFEAAFAAVSQVHQLMSWHEETSDISRLNRQASQGWTYVAPQTLAVLNIAVDLYQRTQGLFDITCERYLRTQGVLPTRDFSDAQTGSPADIQLGRQGEVFFTRPLTINLDGIAKGYAVDEAVAALQTAGVKAGCVNAGGDLRLFGPQPQAVQLRDPRAPDQLLHLGNFQNLSLATTGNYIPHFAAASGTVINPHTGKAVIFEGSLTVACRDCVLADALTKVAILALTNGIELPSIFTELNAKIYGLRN